MVSSCPTVREIVRLSSRCLPRSILLLNMQWLCRSTSHISRELVIKVLRAPRSVPSLRRKRLRGVLNPDFRLYILGLFHA